MFSKTKIDIEATNAAVEDESAPPERGRKKPLAPDLLR